MEFLALLNIQTDHESLNGRRHDHDLFNEALANWILELGGQPLHLGYEFVPVVANQKHFACFAFFCKELNFLGNTFNNLKTTNHPVSYLMETILVH